MYRLQTADVCKVQIAKCAMVVRYVYVLYVFITDIIKTSAANRSVLRVLRCSEPYEPAARFLIVSTGPNVH
jgi:hypothetical protein